MLEETQADRGRLAGIKSKQSEAELRLNNLKMKAELTPELRKIVISPRVMPVRIRRELRSPCTQGTLRTLRLRQPWRWPSERPYAADLGRHREELRDCIPTVRVAQDVTSVWDPSL